MSDYKTLQEHLRVTLPIKRDDPAASGGWTYQEARYRLEIDWIKLQAMARQAWRNKSGRSTDGPIRVVIESKP